MKKESHIASDEIVKLASMTKLKAGRLARKSRIHVSNIGEIWALCGSQQLLVPLEILV